MSYKFPAKDPDDVLDYSIDWTARLDDSDTILTSDWSVTDGDVVIDSQSMSGPKTIVWLSGGTDATASVLLNRVVTQGGRTMDQSVSIKIKSA